MAGYVHPPAPYSGLTSYTGASHRAGYNAGAGPVDVFATALGAKLYRSYHNYRKFRSQDGSEKYLAYDMPFAKRQKLSAYRGGVRKYKKKRRGIVRPSRRAVTLWPRQKLVKLKMAYLWSNITGTGTILVQAIKANSLNDPTGSLNAQLPLGLDQWAAMYQKSVVVGGKIYLRCHNVSGTGSMMYGVTLKNTATTLNDYTYYLESPLTRSKMLSSDVDHSAVALTYSAKRFWNVKKFLDAEDQQASFTTSPGDPADIAYFHLWVHDTSTSEAQTFEMVVTQEFYVLLFDPIVPARSSL